LRTSLKEAKSYAGDLQVQTNHVVL